MLATTELHTTAQQLIGDLPEIDAGDLYLNGADAYDLISSTDKSEIQDVVTLARGITTPVLELACGSGRLAIPLLAAGHHVVGVDNAPRMIEILKERVATKCPRFLPRLEALEGDMATLALDRTFDLVYCGITSVTVLPDEARQAMFRSAYNHLTPNGRFVFSVMTIDGAGIQQDEIVVAATGHDQTDLFVFFERVDHDQQLRTVSILQEPLGPANVRALYTTQVQLLDPSQLIPECEAAGLKVCDVRTTKSLPGRQVLAIECMRAEQ